MVRSKSLGEPYRRAAPQRRTRGPANGYCGYKHLPEIDTVAASSAGDGGSAPIDKCLRALKRRGTQPHPLRSTSLPELSSGAPAVGRVGVPKSAGTSTRTCLEFPVRTPAAAARHRRL